MSTSYSNIIDFKFNPINIFEKIVDYFWHLSLPLLAMIVSGFAGLTFLTINYSTNIGHFQINESKYPTFKYSIIFNDIKNLKHDILKRTLNHAISESEKFFPAFQLVLWAGKTAEEAILFSDFTTEGKA